MAKVKVTRKYISMVDDEGQRVQHEAGSVIELSDKACETFADRIEILDGSAPVEDEPAEQDGEQEDESDEESDGFAELPAAETLASAGLDSVDKVLAYIEEGNDLTDIDGIGPATSDSLLETLLG